MGGMESPFYSFGLAAVESGQGGAGGGPSGRPSLSPLSPGRCSSPESELTTSLAGEPPLPVRPGVAPPTLPQVTPPRWVLATALPGGRPELPPVPGAARTLPALLQLASRFSGKPLAGRPAAHCSPPRRAPGRGQLRHYPSSYAPCLRLHCPPRPSQP